MKARLIIILVALLATGCAQEQGARSLLDRIEFEEGERGCVDLRATIDLNPLPLFTSNASLVLKKNTGDDAPQC